MSYWTEVDPPMSFIPEGWTYEQKREFRYKTIPYLPSVACFRSYNDKRVLCIGDGGGIDAIEFARHDAIVDVIDMSQKAVALTKQHAKEAGVQERLHATVGDACQIPFGHSAFDVVYSFGVIHHIPEVNRAVDEIARVLKPGGLFMGMVYHRDSLLYAYSILARAQREGITPDEAMRRYSERNPGCPHSVAYTRQELLQLLAPRFAKLDMEVRYDVIDLPNQRKVPFDLRSNSLESERLGWHLFFHATK